MEAPGLITALALDADGIYVGGYTDWAPTARSTVLRWSYDLPAD